MNGRAFVARMPSLLRPETIHHGPAEGVRWMALQPFDAWIRQGRRRLHLDPELFGEWPCRRPISTEPGAMSSRGLRCYPRETERVAPLLLRTAAMPPAARTR